MWNQHNQEAFTHQQLNNLRLLMRKQMNEIVASILSAVLVIHKTYITVMPPIKEHQAVFQWKIDFTSILL